VNVAARHRSIIEVMRFAGSSPQKELTGGFVALMRLAALVLALAVSQTAPADDLIGAASNRQLWLILSPRGERATFELVQHPFDEAEWRYRSQHSMTQSPAAVAAWNDAVWLVMPPRSIAGRWQRDVFTARVQKNPATGLYYTTPAGRLEVAPPLEGLGRLAGIVALPNELVALLTPSPRTSTALSAAGNSDTSKALVKPMLLRLGRGQTQWTEIEVPPEFAGSRDSLLLPMGTQPGLLEPIADNPERCRLHVLHADDRWSTTAFPMNVRAVEAVAQVAGQAVVALRGRSPGRIDFTYVRPTGLVAFASASAPDGPWLACGFNDQLLVIEREQGNGEAVLSVRVIDPLTGAVNEGQHIVRQPVTAGRMWQMTLALGLALSMVVAALLLAPRQGTIELVAGSRVLPLGRRAAALAIDLALGAAPAMLLLRCAPADLVSPPLFTFELATSAPYLVMVAIASAIALTVEVLTGRSLGKAIVGGMITALDGSRAKWWQILLRGMLRLIVLLIPPLAVAALFNSHLQGLPDVAARTLVLRRDAEDDAPDAGA